MRQFLLSEKSLTGDESILYEPVFIQEMAKKAKLCDAYFSEQVARVKQQKIEEEQKRVEERRKKEELTIENIPENGVLSSPVTGKSVRKTQPQPKTQAKNGTGSQKPTTTAASNAPRPRSQPQSQSVVNKPNIAQPVVNKPNIEQQPQKRKASPDWELTEKLNRVIKQSKTERIQNRKKEIGYKTVEKTENPRYAVKS